MASKTLIYVLAVVLFFGGALLWYVNRQRSETSSLPTLTPDAKAYVRNLQLSLRFQF